VLPERALAYPSDWENEISVLFGYLKFQDDNGEEYGLILPLL